MVIDKIENAKLYFGLGKRIAKALDYICETDFTQTALGKYEIEKETIFAIVQEYNTKEVDDCKLESHYKFIDIQYIVSGVECMGVSTLIGQIPVTKNEDKDVAFYESDSTLIPVEEGMFTIFFPDDLHMPGVKFNHISKVLKVVMKIRIG